ncbi:MAG TPA: UbiA family prenyltransferase [Candidatus Norongarragalinales archaeon]|nr:UbiA family prenyltransferase [Candidatus Norongarragalinales archaeon]
MPKKTVAEKQSKADSWKVGSLKDWIALTRAEHALIVAIAVIASEFVVSKRFSFAQMLYPALGPALITLGAFAWNDFFGVKTDAAMKRLERPLVSGKIGRKTAFYGALLFFALGLIATLFVSQTVFIIAALFTVASMLYDPVLKKIPLLGNAFIASSMSISFLYGNYVFSDTLNPYVLLFAGISFLAGLGRELILTLRDMEGDRKIGAKTLPMLIGTKKTVILASALFHLAVGLSFAPLMNSIKPAYLMPIAVTDVLFLLTAWTITFKQTPLVLKKARNYTLYGLLIGVIAFATLGF